MTLNTSLLGLIYHACTSTPLYQSAVHTSTPHLKCLASTIPKIRLGPRKNGSH